MIKTFILHPFCFRLVDVYLETLARQILQEHFIGEKVEAFCNVNGENEQFCLEIEGKAHIDLNVRCVL